jgi:hypothetical protein
MNKKEATLVTIIFLSLMTMGFVLTFNTFSNLSLRSILLKPINEKPVIVTSQIQKCSDEEPIVLDNTATPELKKLSQYQDVCNSFVSREMMIFTEMPSTPERAVELGNSISERLKSFSLFGVKPILIIEPVDGTQKISFKQFSQGKYNNVINIYFETIKKNGILDEQLGTVVPFPEANVPYWNHDGATPDDFAININIFLRTMKTQFPKAKGSFLLNSITYSPDDVDWANGNYETFTPYVKNIDRKVVDSIGVQGFPWVSAKSLKGPRTELFTAAKFMGMDFAMEAGETLDTRDIWVNTGTFSAKYTNSPEQKSTVSPAGRKEIFNEIINELVRTKNERFRVRLNIFAEDKSNTREATNWTYLDTEEGQSLFIEVVRKLEDAQIDISIFDTEKKI